jgi:hypothetical protein
MTHPRRWLAVCFVLLGSTLFGAEAPQAPSQDDSSVAKQFIGMWRLVSWPQRLADGTINQNPLSTGYIIYTDTSPVHMCYVGMDPNRPKWGLRGKNPFSGGYAPTSEEVATAFRGSAGYCSTVEVHAQEGFVLHHIEIDKNPNLVGLTRKRFFTFDGPNRVSLRIDPAELPPPVVDSTLVWERIR